MVGLFIAGGTGPGSFCLDAITDIDGAACSGAGDWRRRMKRRFLWYWVPSSVWMLTDRGVRGSCEVTTAGF